MRFVFFGLWFVSFLVVFISQGCISDSEEMLNKGSTCDTLQVSYQNRVQPILMNRCYGCHTTSIQEAGIVLDSYETARLLGESGQLLGTITHSNGYSPMPYEEDIISDCEISVIRNWIQNEYPE